MIFAFSRSQSFLSSDLTWLDMYICLSLFNPCLHSGETRYNLNKWCFGLLNILNLLKQPQKISNVLNSSPREFPKKRFRTTVGLSMDMKYEC